MSQTTNTTKRSALNYQEVKLPPGGERKYDITGRHCAIAEVEGLQGKPFQMRFNNEPFFDMTVGLGFATEPGDYFSSLTFKNPSETDEVVIGFYAGTLQLIDSRLNIVRGRSAPVSIAETVITGGEISIDPDAYLDITDDLEVGEGDDFQKRSANHKLARVIVTNLDPAVDITLCNMSSGGAFGTVFPRQARIVDSSEGCRIFNESAAPVLVRVEIVWWKFDY